MRFYRLFAMVLAVVTVALPLNLDLFAAADASFMGRVTGADGLAPRTGAVVALVLGEGDAIYRSEPTDARGAFKVGGAPAGTYRVVVETDSGAFLASDGIALKNGENGPVSLALQPNRQDAPATPPANPPQVRRGGLAPWAKWVVVGGIAVAGAVIINSLGDDDEGSQF
jgi:hypothetical protein